MFPLAFFAFKTFRAAREAGRWKSSGEAKKDVFLQPTSPKYSQMVFSLSSYVPAKPVDSILL